MEKLKKIVYYLCTIVLLLFDLAFMNIIKCVLNYYENSVKTGKIDSYIPYYDVNGTMFWITALIVIPSILIKEYIRKKYINQDSIIFKIDRIIFIILLLICIHLNVITQYA